MKSHGYNGVEWAESRWRALAKQIVFNCWIALRGTNSATVARTTNTTFSNETSWLQHQFVLCPILPILVSHILRTLTWEFRFRILLDWLDRIRTLSTTALVLLRRPQDHRNVWDKMKWLEWRNPMLFSPMLFGVRGLFHRVLSPLSSSRRRESR